MRRAGAHPGRGRVHRDARRLPPSAQGGLRAARDPLRRRRGADGRRAHRAGLGDRALRDRAGPARVRQVARRRAAARRRDGARGGRWTHPAPAASAARSAATPRRARPPAQCSTRWRPTASGRARRSRLERCARASTRWPSVCPDRRGARRRADARARARRGPRPKRPAGELAKATVGRALEGGLILLTCGLYGNVVRILVPLVASDEDVDRGLEIMEEALVGAAG